MAKDLDWKNLSFSYMETNAFVKVSYKDGAWQDIVECTNPMVPMHIAATSLHYGQECFEGMKVFRGKDGKIRVFRWEENAKRMQRSCEGIMMAQPPLELFKEMMIKVIKLNDKY